jgi:hypothetical protein
VTQGGESRGPGIIPQPLGKAQQLSEETAQRLIRALENSQPVRLLRASQLLSGFLGAVRLLLLAATGLLLRRMAGGE